MRARRKEDEEEEKEWRHRLLRVTQARIRDAFGWFFTDRG